MPPGWPAHPLVIVTGGAGFIGSHLTERLLADGKSVLVVDDLSTGNLENLRAVRSHPRLQVCVSRVSDHAPFSERTREAESIYHLAAAVGVDLVLSSPLQAMETNLRETRAVLSAAAEFNTPVLLTSSSEVYGKSDQEVFSEDDDLLIGPPTFPRWSYACSKLMDEFLALAYARERALPVVLARLFNTVGPRQTGRYGMVMPRFVAAARRGEPLRVFGDGQQSRCFCHVKDTIEALVRLQHCKGARGQVTNVGGVEERTILDLAKQVVSTLKSTSRLDLVPDARLQDGEIRRRRPALERLRSITGFVPSTPLRTMIEDCAAAVG
jgi:UDP-glucose 4-epimerase